MAGDDRDNGDIHIWVWASESAMTWNLQTRFTASNKKSSQWEIKNRRCRFLWVFTHLWRSLSGLKLLNIQSSVIMTFPALLFCFSPKFRLHGQHMSPEYLLTISVRKQRRFLGNDDLHSQVSMIRCYTILLTLHWLGKPSLKKKKKCNKCYPRGGGLADKMLHFLKLCLGHSESFW